MVITAKNLRAKYYRPNAIGIAQARAVIAEAITAATEGHEKLIIYEPCLSSAAVRILLEAGYKFTCPTDKTWEMSW